MRRIFFVAKFQGNDSALNWSYAVWLELAQSPALAGQSYTEKPAMVPLPQSCRREVPQTVGSDLLWRAVSEPSKKDIGERAPSGVRHPMSLPAR